jgi:hypothetical protein
MFVHFPGESGNCATLTNSKPPQRCARAAARRRCAKPARSDGILGLLTIWRVRGAGRARAAPAFEPRRSKSRRTRNDAGAGKTRRARVFLSFSDSVARRRRRSEACSPQRIVTDQPGRRLIERRNDASAEASSLTIFLNANFFGGINHIFTTGATEPFIVDCRRVRIAERVGA